MKRSCSLKSNFNLKVSTSKTLIDLKVIIYIKLNLIKWNIFFFINQINLSIAQLLLAYV